MRASKRAAKKKTAHQSSVHYLRRRTVPLRDGSLVRFARWLLRWACLFRFARPHDYPCNHSAGERESDIYQQRASNFTVALRDRTLNPEYDRHSWAPREVLICAARFMRHFTWNISSTNASTDYLLDTVIAYIRIIAANGRNYIGMVMTIERARAMWVIGAGKLKDVALWKDRVHLWECAHLGEQNIKMLAFLFRHCLRTAVECMLQTIASRNGSTAREIHAFRVKFLVPFLLYRYRSLLSADKDKKIKKNPGWYQREVIKVIE